MTDIMTVKAIAKGLLTYIPGVVNVLDKKKSSTKHSGANAEFCYTLWLSLLEKMHKDGVNPIFERVGELGCGGSVGVGICALLTGTKQYFALEIENHFDRKNNLKLLDEIVETEGMANEENIFSRIFASKIVLEPTIYEFIKYLATNL